MGGNVNDFSIYKSKRIANDVRGRRVQPQTTVSPPPVPPALPGPAGHHHGPAYCPKTFQQNLLPPPFFFLQTGFLKKNKKKKKPKKGNKQKKRNKKKERPHLCSWDHLAHRLCWAGSQMEIPHAGTDTALYPPHPAQTLPAVTGESRDTLTACINTSLIHKLWQTL